MERRGRNRDYDWSEEERESTTSLRRSLAFAAHRRTLVAVALMSDPKLVS